MRGVEVVSLDNGELFVIDGTPDGGYFVHRVGKPVARYDHKYIARRAILDGEFSTPALRQEAARRLIEDGDV